MENATIAAIATPVGSGGIGIIKISGPDAVPISTSIFRNKKKLPSTSENSIYPSFDFHYSSHRLYHGFIVDPSNKKVLDEVLLSVMKAPYSYTKEDVVEIQAHSNPFVLQSILKMLIQKGAKIAEPGEFTKRAFINGRIDLTQAEAIIDIINAKTTHSLNLATTQLTGGLKETIQLCRKTLMNLLTNLEAAIDFPEDVEDNFNIDNFLSEIDCQVKSPLKELVTQYENIHFLREGLKLAIVGKPNVGKSSLMNNLLKKDRSIVTEIPGTTRDLIEDTFILNGIPITVCDTAGLHKTKDPVELVGIDKAWKAIGESDLILFMIDAAIGITKDEIDTFESLPDNKKILVVNKIDLVDKEKYTLDTPGTWKNIHLVTISALFDIGIQKLKDLVTEISVGAIPDCINTIVPNLRHKIALEAGLAAVMSIEDGLKTGLSFELLTIDIQEALDALGEIIGETVKADVLDQIFENFCIGK